jgi:hypothetical protein
MGKLWEPVSRLIGEGSTAARGRALPRDQCGKPMASEALTALIVPQGKVVDFLDGTLRNETPERVVSRLPERCVPRSRR